MTSLILFSVTQNQIIEHEPIIYKHFSSDKLVS